MKMTEQTPEQRFVEAMRFLLKECHAFDVVHIRAACEAFADTNCGGHYSMGDVEFNKGLDHQNLCVARILKGVSGDD